MAETFRVRAEAKGLPWVIARAERALGSLQCRGRRQNGTGRPRWPGMH